MDSYLVFWIVLATVLAVTEVASMAFVAIYFAIGSAAAAVVAGTDAGLEWQLLAFVLTGVVLMAATRPVLKRRLETPDVPANVDRLVGRGAIVTIPVDNDRNTGQVRVGTEFWTARRPDDAADLTVIPVDAHVRIVAVEGVTARVVPRD